MLPHNKIIKTTVKKFLEPENLFQIEMCIRDRTWTITPIKPETKQVQMWWKPWTCLLYTSRCV